MRQLIQKLGTKSKEAFFRTTIINRNNATASAASGSMDLSKESIQQNQQHHHNDKQKSSKINLVTAINDALRISLQTDQSAIVFGEDVSFGGVFRASQNLMDEFGSSRVFNTPLSENGIAGFAVGYASMGGTAIAEIQFADYVSFFFFMHAF